MKNEFAHLRLHTEFSVVDGLLQIDTLMQQAASQGMTAIAITDRGNFFGLVKFYKAAIKHRIKPIIGIDILVEDDTKQTLGLLTLFCQNMTGYRNALALISRGYTQAKRKDIPILPWPWVVEYQEGLIALSSIEGHLGQALLAEDKDNIERWTTNLTQTFPQRFYLEVQRVGKADEELYNQRALNLAIQAALPVIASNDVRFLKEEDFEAHEARVCIYEGSLLADPKRPRRYTSKQYLRSADEMAELFSDIPQALTNTIELAKRCNVYLQLGKNYLPQFPIPEGMSIEDYFSERTKEGLEERLAILLKDKENKKEARKPYDERLEQELKVINQMGFPGYFLIVADFILWAKQQGIPVGPGRGSGPGSLVAYALKITELDPLAYDLLFERFLNPERVSMPDFDIDFCMDNRDRVIDYVAEHYGRQAVSQIITFGTMAAKAVVRDVGRVLGQSYTFVDKIAKLIPFELGMTLTQALRQEDALKELYQQDEEVKNLIDLALKLEGITRNVGKHAGGVVISPSRLEDFTAVYCEEGTDQYVTQLDKDDVEAVGLVKFDFLGLRTLTIIDWAIDAIKQTRHVDININHIPLNDEKTFALLKDCQTTAVFQLESRGMKDLVKRLQPDCFEDIIALVALFRPGPLQSGMVDNFIDRKHGRAKIEYPHPDLETILKPTYGIIVYQEQVMQIAQVLGGYTLGGADLLRRAMGKKKPEEMAHQRTIFVSGALARGVEPECSGSIFDLMEKFAGYGFNKSHSAAYALVSYQTAWLKAHYPAEFMAAVLSSDMDNTDKVVIFLEECQHMKLKIIPPSINQGMYAFTVGPSQEIIYGLGAVKGAGQAAIEHIVEERERGGEYRDLFDFCQRVDLRKVNKRVLEAFVRSGTFDCFKVERASLMASLGSAILQAEQRARNQAVGQFDLFGLSTGTTAERAHYIEAPVWAERERLLGEKETLGLYLSGHPIAEYLPELSHVITARIRELRPVKEQSVIVAGLVVAVRVVMTKKGDRMALMTLDDKSGRIEVAVFPDLFQTVREHLIKDNILIVSGEVSPDEFTGGLRMGAKDVYSLERVRQNFAHALQIRLTQESIPSNLSQQLQLTLQDFLGGNTRLILELEQDKAWIKLPMGNAWLVKPSDACIDVIKKRFPKAEIQVLYK